MTVRVIHHTPYEFPLDSKFFGQTFVIGNHTRNSSLETAVSSPYASTEHDKSTEVNDRVAHSQFNTRLLTGAYIPFNLLYEKSATLKEKIDIIDQTTVKEEPTREYFETFANWIRRGKVAMAAHYFNPEKGYPLFSEMKKIFKDDVSVFVHLHCLADLFLGNLGTPKLTTKQQRAKDVIKRMVDKDDPQFIAVSDAVRASFLQHDLIPSERMTVVKNGIAQDLYSPVSAESKEHFRRTLGIDADRLVGYVGRLEPIKGSENILSMLKVYEQNPQDVGFVFASSDGDQMKRFMEGAEKHCSRLIRCNRLKFCVDVSKALGGLSSKDCLVNSHFYNVLTDKDFTSKPYFAGIINKPLQPYLDAYIQASNSEAIGLSVLEALMSGVPVIASRVGGIPEIVSEKEGTLIDVIGRRPREIARDIRSAVKYWVANPFTMEQAEAQRKRYIGLGFDAKTMAQKLDKIYMGTKE